MTHKKLVKKECACYFTEQNRIENYCCLIDKSCVFFTDEELPVCEYYRAGVVPLEPELEYSYKTDRGIEARGLRKCSCGDFISAKSNRQKYCEGCRKKHRREQTKNSMRKLRKAS